jgi:hypothetical protein
MPRPGPKMHRARKVRRICRWDYSMTPKAMVPGTVCTYYPDKINLLASRTIRFHFNVSTNCFWNAELKKSKWKMNEWIFFLLPRAKSIWDDENVGTRQKQRETRVNTRKQKTLFLICAVQLMSNPKMFLHISMWNWTWTSFTTYRMTSDDLGKYVIRMVNGSLLVTL